MQSTKRYIPLKLATKVAWGLGRRSIRVVNVSGLLILLFSDSMECEVKQNVVGLQEGRLDFCFLYGKDLDEEDL